MYFLRVLRKLVYFFDMFVVLFLLVLYLLLVLILMSSSDESAVFDIKCRERPAKKSKMNSYSKSLFISESSGGVFRLEQKIGSAGGRPRDLEVPNAQLEVVSKMLSTHQELIASQMGKIELIGNQLLKVQGCLDQVLKELEFLKYASVTSKVSEGLPQALPPIPEKHATVPPIAEEPEVVEIPLQKPTPTKMNGSQVIIGDTVNVGSPGKSERVNTFSQSSNHAESRLTPGCVRSGDAENLLVFRRETQPRLVKILNEIEVPHAKESLHVWAWLIETIAVFSSEELEKCNVALDVSIPNLHLSEKKLIGTLLQERNSSGHKGVCVQKACTNGG